MLTKRMFDGVVIIVVLSHPVVGLFRMAARRWQREGTGPMATVGATVRTSLGG